MFNILEMLYHKILVTIVKKSESTDIYIEVCSRKAVISHLKKSFNTVVMNEEMFDFIKEQTKESPYSYITTIDTSHLQGVIPTCDKLHLEDFHDMSTSEYKCYNEKWTYFTSKTDLYEIEKLYEKSGVDFIFSPFTILSHFFKDKINTNMALYILIQEESLSLTVFNNSMLLFGEYLTLDVEEELYGNNISQIEDEEIDLGEEEGIDLEDIDISEGLDDLDDLDELDDFADIEDLDSLEEIDDFGENQDVEEVFYEAEDELIEEESEDNFNDDYQRYSLIQASLGKYYKSDKYDSQFIENVYIADGVGISQELKRYLEEEMFLNVYVRNLDLCAEVTELTKMELNICTTAI